MQLDATPVPNDEPKPTKRLNAFSKVQPVATTSETTSSTMETESYVLNEDRAKVEGDVNDDEQDTAEPEEGTTLFLRNLKFTTREDAIRQHFRHIGRIHHIQVAMKKDPEDPNNRISLGYGFIQFKLHKDTEKALKTMQITSIEGNSVELKRSDRTLQ